MRYLLTFFSMFFISVSIHAQQPIECDQIKLAGEFRDRPMVVDYCLRSKEGLGFKQRTRGKIVIALESSSPIPLWDTKTFFLEIWKRYGQDWREGQVLLYLKGADSRPYASARFKDESISTFSIGR